MSIRPIIEGFADSGGGSEFVAGDAYRVANEADLQAIPGYSSGTITVPTGTVLTIDQISAPIVSDTDFVLEGTAEMRIRSSLAKATWQYTKEGGTFISGQGIRATIFNIELESVAATSTFIDTFNCTLNLDGAAVAAFTSLGRMEGTGLTALDLSGARSFISDFGNGLDLKNMVVSGSDFVVTSFNLTGDAFNIENDIPLPIVTAFNGVITFMTSLNNVFNVNPISTDNFKMSVAFVESAGGEGLFNTSNGATGAFTSVADGSVSIGIDSVQNNGSGLAEFNLSASPDSVYVGEVVTISGYTTNTAYNGIFIVTSKPTATSFVVDVDFGTDEVGGQVDADVLTLTDTATTVSDGDTLTISTDNALTYDGGAIVFNKQTNTFQINGSFDGTESGTWDTSSLDQGAPGILASNNPGFAPSTISSEVSFKNNTFETDIPVTAAKVLVNSEFWNISTTERTKEDSKGGVIYTGLEPATIKADGNLYLRPVTSNNLFLRSQFLRQKGIRNTCTFDAGSETVNTTSAHGLVVGDTISFNDTEGVLDSSLRDDIIYYVESTPTATSFTLSYTDGGALIALTGGGLGNTSYAETTLSGSEPVEPIGSGRPRTLVPQAIGEFERGDKVMLYVSNETNNTNIVVIEQYYRFVL